MATFFSTVAKISRLEQMAREASGSSSSDNSTSSLFTLSPWIQEARYALNQQRAAVAAVRLGRSSVKNDPIEPQQRPQPRAESPQTKTAVAIFKSQTEGHFVDYRNPQPVFLAPLAGLTHPGGPNEVTGGQGKADYEKHDSIYAKRSLVPMGLLTTSTEAGPQAKAAPLFFTTSPTTQDAIQDQRNQEIEEQMAAEAEAKEAEERAEVAAVVLLEKAYRKNAGNTLGVLSSGSSRSSSIIGNNSSPDSQSPSPPTAEVMNNVSESSKNNNSPSSAEDLRRPWKKRYHEVAVQEADELEKKRSRNSSKAEKRSKSDQSSTTNTDSGPVSSMSSGSTNEEEDLTSSDASTSPKASSNKQ